MKNKQNKPEVSEKALPGAKLNMEKQIAVLKAFVVYFEKNKKSASYKEIASIVKASPTNVSDSLKFWKSIGILVSEGGAAKPSQKLSEAIRTMEWEGPDKGWMAFRDAIKNSWFVEHLMMAFRLKSPMSEADIVSSLGQSYGSAGKSKIRKPLKNLFQLLVMSGVILKDEKGNLTFNKDVKISERPETIVVNETKDMIQIKIENELFAVDVQLLKEFVAKNGKRLDDTTHDIG